MDNNGNIVLNQILADGSSFKIKEMLPLYIYSDSPQTLIKQGNDIYWTSIDLSLNVIVNDHFKDTEIYYNNGRMGLGRFPLFNYKVDIAIPKNTLMTAFHIGDGSFGFSMGNGTAQGFIPEIIGISSNKDDVGLYFIGASVYPDNDINNKTPLIILDGRIKCGKAESKKLENRPILGISNCDYSNCVVLIDSKGNIFANDLLVNNISLNKKIQELEDEINKLKRKRRK